MDSVFRKELALGALLHDIGKFKQRAGLEEDSGPHTEIGYNWLKTIYESDVVAGPARSHHAGAEETWLSNANILVFEADNCSATERRSRFDPQKDRSCTWQREICLATVFSRVTELEDRIPAPAYHPLETAEKWTVPVSEKYKADPGSYRRLWQEFSREFEGLKDEDGDWDGKLSRHYNIDIVMHLLEKYTSAIPSITLEVTGQSNKESYFKHPDISLFDHLKTTAAFTLCLYDYYQWRYGEKWNEPGGKLLVKEITSQETWKEEADRPFLLVGGDLSGIQRFIYTISSKGALRSLKGRSFFLELLTEHVVDRLLEETNLYRCNVIYTGGGHFYLIAGNTPAVKEALEKVRGEINAWLLEKHAAALYQCIEAEPMGKYHLRSVSGIWSKLATRLEKAKMRKWKDRLEQIFESPRSAHEDCLTTRCKVCGREDLALKSLGGEDEKDTCEACHELWNLGCLLQKAVRQGADPVICRWDANVAGIKSCVEICGRFYSPMSTFQEAKASNPTVVYHLNQWDMAAFRHECSRPLMAGVYMPGQSRFKELEELVKEGMGMNKLSVLRMDVDNLGRIFAEGVPEKERTLTRMASLSRQLSLFFKYHINGILAVKEGYPQPCRVLQTRASGAKASQGPPAEQERLVNIVYSGGDDLFIIGHWKDVVETAIDIQRAFAKFVANPFITISAGITQDHVHQPVYRLAESAGLAERRSKEKDRTKNKVTFNDHYTFKWDQVDEIAKWFRVFSAFSIKKGKILELEKGGISMGMLYRLLEISRRMRRQQKWNIVKLAWLLGRVQIGKGFEAKFKNLKNKIMDNNPKWHQLELALTWHLMLMRKGETTK